MKGDFYNYRFLANVREAKYTQEQFAKLLKVNTVTLSRLENGHSASYELIVRACQLLDLDSSKIFYSSRQLTFAT
jgi:transcriptional regulator with XRE-family HTH domain